MASAHSITVAALVSVLLAGTVSPAAAAGTTDSPDRRPSAAVVRASESDAYEPDNTPATAKALDGGVHTFGTSGGGADVDWVYFDAVAGHRYQVTSYAYDRGSNETWIVPLAICDPSGAHVLAYQAWYDRWYDGYWGELAKVGWTAPSSGRYYVQTFDLEDGQDPEFLQYTIGLEDFGVVGAGTLARVDGADRYEVAAKLARNPDGTFTGTTDIIIASGLDAAMADALSAAGLAGTLNAPILLARGDRAYLPAPTAAAIRACATANPGSPIRFHIVGGVASVPRVLEGQLRKAAGAGATVERLAGADRYVVAANVATHMRSHGAEPDIAYIVNGQNPAYFPDALAVSPFACGGKRPILLVKSTMVPPATAAQLRYYGGRFLVGSPGRAITAAVGRAVTTGASWSYWSDGTSRDAVARILAEREEHGVQLGWLAEHSNTYRYTVANKLSDALTAGCSPSLPWHHVLYVDAAPDSMGLLPDGTEQFFASRAIYDPGVTIVGGTASVGTAVEHRLRYLVGDTAP